jgi:hypothetical protein
MHVLPLDRHGATTVTAKEIEERHRRAWDDFKVEEQAKEVAVKAKAEREKWLKNHHDEQRHCLDD